MKHVQFFAKGCDVGCNCTCQSLCENCMYDWVCWQVPAKFYRKCAVSMGICINFVSGEAKMMKELSRVRFVWAMGNR